MPEIHHHSTRQRQKYPSNTLKSFSLLFKTKIFNFRVKSNSSLKLKDIFENKNHKIKQIINRDLAKIRTKLKLPTPLQLGKARDCYASTLMRNGQSHDDIGQM